MYGTCQMESVLSRFHLGVLQSKICITQAKPKGIQDILRGEGLKPAITDVDILLVVVEFLFAKIGGRGIGLIAACHGVRQPAAGADVAAQQIGDGISALHAALPHDHCCADFTVKCIHPGEIHDAADVQQYNGFFKMRCNGGKEMLLLIGQVIAPLFQRVFAVFAGGAPNRNNSRITAGGGAGYHRIGDGHLGVKARPAAPESVIRWIFRAPVPIRRRKFLIDLQLLTGLQAVDQADLIGLAHVAAGSVACVEPVVLHSAEYGDLLLRMEREHPVVFQQNGAFSCGATQQRGHLRRRFAVQLSPFLAYVVLREVVDNF